MPPCPICFFLLFLETLEDGDASLWAGRSPCSSVSSVAACHVPLFYSTLFPHQYPGSDAPSEELDFAPYWLNDSCPNGPEMRLPIRRRPVVASGHPGLARSRRD